MRITRFIDENGTVQHGIAQQDGTAQLLKGDIQTGFMRQDEQRQISRILAPLTPVNIFCIGLNYREHAQETGAPIPDTPVVFMKPTTAVNHHQAEILLPAACNHGPEVDYEAELCVIIGKTARNVAQSDALDYVFGYTCANDVSARRWQKHGGGGQWIRGKSFDSFCPLGPVMVTADEIPDPQTLRVRSQLNGAVMQDGNTSDMIFPIASLIHHLSQDLTLLPGTVILTGTPSGVGFARNPQVFLAEGDEISVEIDVIGKLQNRVVNAV
ncbi:MAG: 5-carboxymethyl-2-hydroxymuconate isomerase [Sedimenticola sp.]|nr:MAG: 5-carboxymethyl-2-hydroxymuconate isomerase [Sedimenticola sp.]